MLILSPVDSDAATITASSEVGALVAANLQTRDPDEKWRGQGTTESLTIAFASSPPEPDTLALVSHNLSDAGVLRVRGAQTEAALTASPDIDTGWVSAWPATGKPAASRWSSWTALVRWTAPGPLPWLRLDIVDPSAQASYIEAGRLMAGKEWRPSLNFGYDGTPLGFDPTDIQTRMPSGKTFTDRRSVRSAARVFEVSFFALNQRNAFDGIYEIQRLAGLDGDVVISLDPGATTDFHRFIMQGVFTQGAGYTLPPAFDEDGNMFGAATRLRELI